MGYPKSKNSLFMYVFVYLMILCSIILISYRKDKLIINALQTKGKCMSRNTNNFNGNQKYSKDQNNYANIDKGKQKQNCAESKDKPCGNINNRYDIIYIFCLFKVFYFFTFFSFKLYQRCPEQ